MKVEPNSWFVGMKEPNLQLMVSAPDIANAEVTTSYPGVVITSVVRLDSLDYLFVNLEISNVEAGVMPLTFKWNDKEETVDFPFYRRKKAGESHHGFSKADVVYLLMPDRFAQGRKDNSAVETRHSYTINRKKPELRHGGDLEGIRQHLDYFVDLGVTALWLTPVLENDAPETATNSCYHGYAITDYYTVDPRYGSNEDYCNLIDECHSKGLKVLMDMVFNHCGIAHPWVANPPSEDWFNSPGYQRQTRYRLTPVVDPYASDVDYLDTVEGWFVSSMPDLNLHNEYLLNYLVQNSIWWIETADIDGIRIDTFPYADGREMSRWLGRLSKEYPHFNVVGETWVTEAPFTAALQTGSKVNPWGFDSGLHSVMDFALFDRLNRAKCEETDEWFDGLNRIYETFVYDYLYPHPEKVMAFLDNHDTNRFLGGDVTSDSLRQALAILLTVNRIPQIYYGTEILLGGDKEKSDGQVRQDFPGGFPSDEDSAFTAEGRSEEQQKMYEWLRTVLHWRKGNITILEGKQKQYLPLGGVYVMTHSYKGRYVMIVLNGTSEDATFKASHYSEDVKDNVVATEVTTGEKYTLTEDFTLTPHQTLILEY